MEDSNGYGTNATTRHNWTREENKRHMICYYKSILKLKVLCIAWKCSGATATLDLEQLNYPRYSLQLEKLSRLAKLNDTVQEEVEKMSDSPTETPNVLVD